mgnify:CR=1 FL=1
MTSPVVEETPLTRSELPDHTRRVLRGARGAKPSILLVEREGCRLIVKDFAQARWLVRHTYGRWIVANETRIYRHLAGVEGVPAFRGRIDAFAFAVDYVDAADLKSRRRKSLPGTVFDRLAELHAALHERGVVHLDAHQRKNILLTADGRPFLVDFATSLYLGTGWFSRRALIPFLAQADRLGLQKLRARYSADRQAPDEAQRHRVRWMLGWLWPYTAVRRVKRILRRRARHRARGRP